MPYKKYFDPFDHQSLAEEMTLPRSLEQLGDRRDKGGYVYDDEIILAVNVAIATARPLLIRGPSGSGKSSLARHVAEYLGWRYYDEVITSRTQARDLLWRFDALRRLRDAQAKEVNISLESYIEPGVLWWAFNRESARRRGSTAEATKIRPAVDPGLGFDHPQAVVLLDEIDKADPDVPNDLLIPLGSGQFIVQETGFEVKAQHSPLIFITTNEERVMPAAFLRRCVVLVLKSPGEERLVEIAVTHFGSEYLNIYQKIASYVIELRQEKFTAKQIMPSTAEYLDTVLACIQLNINLDEPNHLWKDILRTMLIKPRELAGGV